MILRAKSQSVIARSHGYTCSLSIASLANGLMLTKTPHLFDDATQVTAGDSRWQGKTSEDYWAFVGPFGGATAATILRALIDHPQRAGDPLSLTVNFCAPVAQGAFDLDVRLVKANRSSQHWCVEMTQDGGEVATLATAVFAERRPSWDHKQAPFPGATPFAQARSFPRTPMTWTHQYDFRFVEGSRVSTVRPHYRHLSLRNASRGRTTLILGLS